MANFDAHVDIFIFIICKGTVCHWDQCNHFTITTGTFLSTK